MDDYQFDSTECRSVTPADDFSRRDVKSPSRRTAGSYSRFRRESLTSWAQEPDVNMSESFRELILEINPNNISCSYKQLFENNSINKLRAVDTWVKGRTRLTKPTSASAADSRRRSLSAVQRQQQRIEMADVSNSAIFRSSASAYSIVEKETVRGWDICRRPHSAGCCGYVMDLDDILRHRRYITKEDQQARNPISNAGKQIPWKNNFCRPDTSLRRSYRERPIDESRSLSSTSTAPTTSPIKVGKGFTHYDSAKEYMAQYRTEYTYKKLGDVKPICAEPSLCSFQSSSCCTMIPVPAKAASSRFYQWSTPRVSPITLAAREDFMTKLMPAKPISYLKGKTVGSKGSASSSHGSKGYKHYDKFCSRKEVFCSPLTVTNYNPTCTMIQGQHFRTCDSPLSSEESTIQW